MYSIFSLSPIDAFLQPSPYCIPGGSRFVAQRALRARLVRALRDLPSGAGHCANNPSVSLSLCGSSSLPRWSQTGKENSHEWRFLRPSGRLFFPSPSAQSVMQTRRFFFLGKISCCRFPKLFNRNVLALFPSFASFAPRLRGEASPRHTFLAAGFGPLHGRPTLINVVAAEGRAGSSVEGRCRGQSCA